METTTRKLLRNALVVAGVLVAALVLSMVAFESCALTSGSSGTAYHDGAVYYDPSSNPDEEDSCVAAYERFMAATEAGADGATMNALLTELEECSGPGEVGVIMGTTGLGAVGVSLLYWVLPLVVAVIIGNAIYDVLRRIVRRRRDD